MEDWTMMGNSRQWWVIVESGGQLDNRTFEVSRGSVLVSVLEVVFLV